MNEIMNVDTTAIKLQANCLSTCSVISITALVSTASELELGRRIVFELQSMQSLGYKIYYL
jgi:hypothetical protein